MNVIPVTPITLELARRVIWFESPEQALSDPIRFMAYAMTYARHEDMRELRRYLSDDDIREALDRAPAGIIDRRSWAYWNVRMGRYPAPQLPVRMFAASPGLIGRKQPRQPPVVTPNSEEKAELEDQWRANYPASQQTRAPDPAKAELEEVRRKAREDWRDKYGGRK
jgi:hypothetical protein